MVEDILTYIVDRVKAGADVESIRHEVGGDEYYIARRPRMSVERVQQIARDLKRKPVAEVAKETGISERTCRRIRARFNQNGP